MKEITIKISGSGTKSQIIGSLSEVINDITSLSEEELDNIVWEDECLLTEINHID